MNALLMGLLIVGAAAAVAYYMRNRQPRSLDDGIRSFHREMEALAPHTPDGTPRSTGDLLVGSTNDGLALPPDPLGRVRPITHDADDDGGEIEDPASEVRPERADESGG